MLLREKNGKITILKNVDASYGIIAAAYFSNYELTEEACKNWRHIWPITKPEVGVKRNMTDRTKRQ